MLDRLKAAWVRARIALIEGDEMPGIAGWLFLLVPATVVAYFLARWWGPLGWILFVGCCAGLVGVVLVPWLLLDRCPACNRKSLQGRPDRRVMEQMNQGVRANPGWRWSECLECKARFKRRHHGDGSFERVGDQEWNESVWARKVR